ncbi:hypothetical protein A8990_1841, partial [Paenibacillus taihuensis]
MRKFFSLLFLSLFIIITLNACGADKTTTNAVVKVVEKNENLQKKNFSIVVETLAEDNPEHINLKVANEDIWDLIILNQNYSIIYTVGESSTIGHLKK